MQDIDIYIDQDKALERIGGNKNLYKKLLLSFINDPLMDSLAEDIGRGNIQGAAQTAHAIKGSSANLSLIKLTETVKLLETGLKAGSCDKYALEACFDAFDKTKEAINEILKSNAV